MLDHDHGSLDIGEKEQILSHPENPLVYSVTSKDELNKAKASFGGVEFIVADDARIKEIAAAIEAQEDTVQAEKAAIIDGRAKQRADLIATVKAETGDAKVNALLTLQNFDAGIVEISKK